MAGQLLDHSCCDDIMRRTLAAQGFARDAVNPLGIRVPVGPVGRGGDQMAFRTAILEDPGDLDRLAPVGQRRGLEIEKDVHG
jgi:hypothetical protein